MKKLQIMGTLAGMGLATVVLVVSVWKQVEERAYEIVVPKNLQLVMKAEEINEGGEQLSLWQERWNYYPRVVGQRLGLWLKRDEEEKLWMMLELAKERNEWAKSLIEAGEQVEAVKVVNKALAYLEQASSKLEASELGEKEALALWEEVYWQAVDQEVFLWEMKAEVNGLAEGVMNDLCQQAADLRAKAKDEIESGIEAGIEIKAEKG